MSFREKSAWIFLISILGVGGFYFLHVPRTLNPSHSPTLVKGLFYCIGALIVIEVVAFIVVILTDRNAPGPKDERERLIDLKAIRWAHYVYLIGSLLAVSTIHRGANAIAISYLVLLSLVIGEIVKNVIRIVYHRRGV